MRKRLQKVIALMLSMTCMGSMLTGCTGGAEKGKAETKKEAGRAESDNPYGEKLTFKVFSLDYPDGFMDATLVTQAKEKFNIDFEIQQVAWDSWDETTRTLAATGSLPEVLSWYNLNYGEYKTWVEQGVFKALPEDLTAYPKLKEVLDSLDVTEKLFVDGKLYAIPKKAITQPFNEFRNSMIIYRKDWAEAMGYDFDPVQKVTYDELVKYLEDLKEKDPAGLGDKLIPLDFNSGGLDWVNLAGLWDKNIDAYYKNDGEYAWGARDPEVLVGIKEVKELYDAGLLYRDGYADGLEAGLERFSAGRSGMVLGDNSITKLGEMADDLKKAVPGFTDEDLGILAISMPDGKIHTKQMAEWWAATAFSANCSDEIMERWLAVGNWLMEDEQIETYAYGEKDVDWSKSADGDVTINWSAEEVPDHIVNGRVFQKFFIMEGSDQWLEGNPAIRSYLQWDLYKGYFELLGAEQEKGNVHHTSIDYDVDFFTGTNHNQYGNLMKDVQSAVIQAVVSKDPETVWSSFLNDSAAKIDSVLEELNRAY